MSNDCKKVHEALVNDDAYVWSVENEDAWNMQLVLRAHRYAFNSSAVHDQLAYAIPRMEIIGWRINND